MLIEGGPKNFLKLLLHFVYCIYCPPSSSVSIFDDLCSALYSSFLLIGNFNVDFCNQNHVIVYVLFFFTSHPILYSYQSIRLNHFLTLISDVNRLQYCVTIPLLASFYHLGISLTLNIQPCAARPCKS